MAVQLETALIEKINAKDTLKVIATISPEEIPHVVFKDSLFVNEKGQLELLEILESSSNNRNLVYSIWYDKQVAVNVLDAKGDSFELLAKPIRSITAGKEFEKRYVEIREKLGDVDLGAIWKLEVTQIKQETLRVRQAEDETNYPILKHLDRFIHSGEVSRNEAETQRQFGES